MVRINLIMQFLVSVGKIPRESLLWNTYLHSEHTEISANFLISNKIEISRRQTML